MCCLTFGGSTMLASCSRSECGVVHLLLRCDVDWLVVPFFSGVVFSLFFLVQRAFVWRVGGMGQAYGGVNFAAVEG